LSATEPEASRCAVIHAATERDLVAVARVHLDTVVPAYAGIFPPDVAVHALTERFPRAELWVLERNTRARAMYERRGWALVPDRRLEWPGISVAEVRYGHELR
jgi:hypothetical protein